jgi:hypothetical protein
MIMTYGVNGVNALGSTGATTGAAGGMDADFANVASKLGVSSGALQDATHKAEAEASVRIQQLAADGDYSSADKQQVEAEMMSDIQETLGLSNLSDDQMMALAELCNKCLAALEKQVLGANGLSGAQTAAYGQPTTPLNTGSQVPSELSRYSPEIARLLQQSTSPNIRSLSPAGVDDLVGPYRNHNLPFTTPTMSRAPSETQLFGAI